MTCLICKVGVTKPGHATVTLDRDNTVVILRDVPADVCDNCGEYYLSEEITGKVLKRAEVAVSSGHEVEIVKFAA